MNEPLLSISDAVSLYGALASSINTTWGNYVFVLLGMVGWTLARAHEFRLVQKILITIIFTSFNLIILFYFRDAYHELDCLRHEVIALKTATNAQVVAGGFSERWIAFDPADRFCFVLTVVGSIWAFVTYLVWARKIWQSSAARQGA